jgi:hypothetical protein
MAKKRKTWEARLYLGRDQDGHEAYEWIGRFATKRERDEAVALARVERRQREQRAKLPPGERITVAAYADQALERKREGRCSRSRAAASNARASTCGARGSAT